MLETIRVIKAQAPFENDIIFAFVDGEEVGIMGSYALSKHYVNVENIGLVLNFEARGTEGPSLMYETGENNAKIIKEFAESVTHPMTNSLMYEIYKLMPNGSDFSNYKDIGWTGFNFAYIGNPLAYHSELDNVENLDIGSVKHHASYMLDLLNHFGNHNLETLNSEENAVYFDIWRSVVVYYNDNLVMPLLIIAILLFIWLIIEGSRSKLINFKEIIIAAIILPVSMVGVLFINKTLWTLIKKTSYSIYWLTTPNLPRNIYYSDEMLIGFICITSAITILLLSLYNRRIKSANLVVASLVLWLLLGSIVSYIAPGMSYVFVWPVIFICLAWVITLKLTILNNPIKDGIKLISTLPVFILLIPIIWSVSTALGMARVPYIMILIVLIFSLVYNKIPTLIKYKYKVVSVLIIMGCFLIINNVVNFNFNEENPKPNSLIYTYNMDSTEALWGTVDVETDEWTSNFIVDSGSKETLEDYFPFNDMPIFTTSQAREVQLPEPNIKLLNDIENRDTRILNFKINTNTPEGSLSLYFENDLSDIKSIKVGEDNISLSEDKSIEFIVLPIDGINLEVQLSSHSKLKMKAVEQRLGYPDSLKDHMVPRPNYMIPRSSYYTLTNYTYVLKTFEY